MCKGLDENTKIRGEKNSDSFQRIISIQDSSHPGVPTSQGMGHPLPKNPGSASVLYVTVYLIIRPSHTKHITAKCWVITNKQTTWMNLLLCELDLSVIEEIQMIRIKL